MEVSPDNLMTSLGLIAKAELSQRLVEGWPSCKTNIALQKNRLFIALFPTLSKRITVSGILVLIHYSSLD